MISERSFSKSFGTFWHELLPLQTSRFISIFSEAYQQSMADEHGNGLTPLPIGANVRPDLVAEFAFVCAQQAIQHKLPAKEFPANLILLKVAEQKAFEIIKKYEGKTPEDYLPFSHAEITEGLCIFNRYAALYRLFPTDPVIEFRPRFPGAGFLNESSGDIGIETTLIEVKTTARGPSGRDIRQLLTYAALDANRGINRWSHVGIFNPRRGVFHKAEIDALILRLSGGKPKSDVFAELIGFAEGGDLNQDHKF